MEYLLNECRSVTVDECNTLNQSFNNQIYSRLICNRYSFQPKLRHSVIGMVNNYQGFAFNAVSEVFSGIFLGQYKSGDNIESIQSLQVPIVIMPLVSILFQQSVLKYCSAETREIKVHVPLTSLSQANRYCQADIDYSCLPLP